MRAQFEYAAVVLLSRVYNAGLACAGHTFAECHIIVCAILAGACLFTKFFKVMFGFVGQHGLGQHCLHLADPKAAGVRSVFCCATGTYRDTVHVLL